MTNDIDRKLDALIESVNALINLSVIGSAGSQEDIDDYDVVVEGQQRLISNLLTKLPQETATEIMLNFQGYEDIKQALERMNNRRSIPQYEGEYAENPVGEENE